MKTIMKVFTANEILLGVMGIVMNIPIFTGYNKIYWLSNKEAGLLVGYAFIVNTILLVISAIICYVLKSKEEE